MANDSMPSEQDLVRELRALEREISASGKTGTLALARLVRTDQEISWADVLRRHRLADWIAIPLHGDGYPALRQLLARMDELQAASETDSLSALPNRRAFDRALGLEVERAGRYAAPLSLAILDLDDFKKINDTHGHACGDRVIQSAARIFREEIRKIDMAARIGGEEFAILLPGTGLVRAQVVLERVLEKIRAADIVCEGQHLRFTCSVGLASYRGKSALDEKKLLVEADQALYASKTSGKNKITAAAIFDLGRDLNKTLVHQNEKRFLLS